MKAVATTDPRAKRYERTKLVVDLTLWIAEIALLVALIFTGLGLSLRAWLQQYALGSQALLVALYLLALGLGDEVVFFGPRWWRSYRLSRSYGLSVQKFAGWLWDYVKEKVLSGLFILLIVEMLFWLMRSRPHSWWIISGAVISVLMILLAQLAPLILFPLFYKFKPLEDEDLRARLSSLAEKAGVRLDRIDEVNLSSKTRAANAALAGLGNTRRIILGDTLLRSFPNDEIEAVIAHELGHHVGAHVWQRMAAQVVTIFLFLGLIHVTIGYLAARLSYWGISDPASIPLMALVASLAAFVVLPPMNSLMRAMERYADRYAVETTGKPWAMISTLERLARLNIADPNPNRVVEILFHSHPAIARRIAACRKHGEELGLPTDPPTHEEPKASEDQTALPQP